MRLVPLLLLSVACGATPNPRSSGAGLVPAPAATRVASAAAEEPLPPEEPQGEAQVADQARTRQASPVAGVDLPGDHVATVAGQAVAAGDLVTFWFQRDPTAVRDMLEQLTLSRLVVAEASRLGMVIDPLPVEAAWKQALTLLEERVREESAGTTLEDYIRGTLGREPAAFREQLRQEVLLESLASRVVRAWVLSVDRAEVRVIVTASEEAMGEVTDSLAAGADFAELARVHSLEESAGEGGLLPPIVRSETVLSRLAFLTGVGEVGGPVGEQGRFMLIRVEGRPTPRIGLWNEIGAAVEASLALRPVRDPEYWQWKSAIGSRYEVDFRPLLDLVGEPIPMGTP